ncbi:MAG TPA: isoprenylcysteine carboxylmethyltransferase family protein [Steroidobacteraceae bacterium]|nr:isoprenylcysteine carboxylmethyltransferase family protein [Steroidobacteraceae bacterium]
MTAIQLTGYYLGLFYLVSELALSLFRRAGKSAAASADRGSVWVMWATIVPIMFIAFQIEFRWRAAGWPYQAWINVVGIALMLVGLVLRWYSIIHLGRFFTVNVAIAQDHRIIDTGPYRWLRHPSYTGALVAFLGLALCTQNWASLVLIVIGTTAVFSYRMGVEERALTAAFGEPYRQYMQRTWRLIPGLY